MIRRRFLAAAGAAMILFALGAAGSWAAVPTVDNYPVLSSNRGVWPRFVDIGDTLTVSQGSWSGSPSSYSYAWNRCDTTTWTCTAIAGATDASYVPTVTDRGSRLRADVTATNADGNGMTSVWVPVVGAPGPGPGSGDYPSVASSRSGTAPGFVDAGDVLTVSDGHWLGDPTTFSYLWSRCAPSGYPCAAIAGATDRSYTVTAADIGFRLQIEVTATNAVGSATASPYAGSVVGAPAPTVGGYPLVTTSRAGYLSYIGVGDTLSVSEGTWDGSPTSFSYRWARCAHSGYPCTDIDGATGQTYIVVAADRGFRLSVTVTATNGVGSGTYSPWVGNPVGAPVIERSPQLSSSGGGWGSALNAGDTLSVSDGHWLGDPTSFAYQWRRCNTATSACNVIAGATSSSYVVTTADRALRLEVDVTASNDDGSTTTTLSAWNAVGVPGIAPGGYPTLTTTRGPYLSYVGVGDTLTVSPGSWVGEPSSFSYEWRRCSSSTPCAAITGATQQSYTVGEADLGFQLLVVVTATNDVGSGTYTASAGYNVGAPAPEIYPSVTSSRGGYVAGVEVGDTLTVSEGTWLGEPTSFAFQWRRCIASSGVCSDIAGATGRTYVVVAADQGFRLSPAMTATNANGSSVVYPYAGNAVGAPGPVSNAGPSVTSSRGGYLSYIAVGDTLTVSQGTWTGNPTSFSYQWRRCPPASGSGCVDIPGATSSSYTIVAADYGLQIYPVVTATNDVGSSSSSPWAGNIVGAPGYGPVSPSITISRDGRAVSYVEVGDTLTVDPGTWLGDPTSFAYQWRRCRAAYSGCTTIDGATERTYTVVAADQGFQLDVGLTATNAVGQSVIYLAAGNVVGAPTPAPDAYPTIRSSRNGAYPSFVDVGDTLTILPGTWHGNPTGFSYHWERCAAAPPYTCTAIAGATESSYTVTAADHGFRLLTTLTATNAVGSATYTTYAGFAVGAPGIGDRGPYLTNSRPGASTHVGDTLTAENGSWLGSPTSFAYQWRRCTNPTGSYLICNDIDGETGRTYTVTAADLGKFVAVRVTAANDVGRSAAQSYPQRVATLTTTATLTPAAIGGWYVNPTVTLTVEAAPGAEVDYTEYNVDGGTWQRYTQPFTVSGNGLHLIGFRSVDRNGMAEGDNLKGFRVDATKPTISLIAPAGGATYELGASVTASFSCSDADGGSGVASCEGTATNGAAVDTATVGSHSFAVTAKDVAGNTSTLAATYLVAWPFGGLAAPVQPPPAINDVKAGSSVPLKFSLGGDRGGAVLATGSPRSHAVDCTSGADLGDAAQAATPGASAISYDPESKQYVFVWKTQQSWAGTCRVLELGLADTTLHTATFRFK